MSKNVLIISASPRKGGNSDTLCDRFRQGAEEAGNRVEKIRLAELTIEYCSACYWLPAFDMEEEKQKDKNVEGQLAHILDDLKAQKHEISAVTDSDRAVHRQFLQSAGQMPADAWQHLIRVSSRCAGCGVCEKVCPSGSIHVENGRAVHVPGGCQTCLACVHACPEKAVGLTVPEKNPQARYRNPHVSLSEIIRANGRH